MKHSWPHEGNAASLGIEVVGVTDDEIGVVGLLVLAAADEVPGPLVVIAPLVIKVEDEWPVIEELQFPH